jgi:hypothetical protein
LKAKGYIFNAEQKKSYKAKIASLSDTSSLLGLNVSVHPELCDELGAASGSH